MEKHEYVIVGGGLTGVSAIEGIREVDKDGSILMMTTEKHAPYHRPPLSKHLWFDIEQQHIVHDPEWYTTNGIFVHDEPWYSEQDVRLLLETSAVGVDVQARSVTDHAGQSYPYEKLLLATGGHPRVLDIPGSELPGVCYFRTLDDFLALHSEVSEGLPVLVIGGGFIGSEMAAALRLNKADVTLLFPEEYLVSRVFPKSLGQAITSTYQARSVNVLTGDVPVSIEKDGAMLVTHTRNGAKIVAKRIVVGIGIVPGVELAGTAGIDTENGIVVNERLQTSSPDVYAAGDNAQFPYAALGRRVRLEHWDNAIKQGKIAGRNMAGANEPYTHMPFFYSDLFEFGFEAVGDVRSDMETFADWKKENDTGVIYYLEHQRVRGVMMCNVWDQVPAARQMIKKDVPVSPAELTGAIG